MQRPLLNRLLREAPVAATPRTNPALHDIETDVFGSTGRTQGLRFKVQIATFMSGVRCPGKLFDRFGKMARGSFLFPAAILRSIWLLAGRVRSACPSAENVASVAQETLSRRTVQGRHERSGALVRAGGRQIIPRTGCPVREANLPSFREYC